MRAYKCLKQQVFEKDNYKIVPIRDEDKYEIMRWRNEQIYHLRQKEPLTKEKQERYFENVVSKLFDEEQPTQILFSYLENNICIGYGGLVHIDWESKNAEISFITQTNRIKSKKVFESDFSCFLELLCKLSFQDLYFLKLHTTFYDIPERHEYSRIIKNLGFVREAQLKNHILINSELKTVYIYSYFNDSNT